MEPWEKSYEPKRWKTYPIDPLTSLDRGPTIVKDPAIEWCNSTSERARQLESSPRRFYCDWEIVAMGLDPRSGCQVGRLAAPWLGHEAGTLAMLVFTGEPPFTYAIEEK